MHFITPVHGNQTRHLFVASILGGLEYMGVVLGMVRDLNGDVARLSFATGNGDKLMFDSNRYDEIVAGNGRVYVLLEQSLCDNPTQTGRNTVIVVDSDLSGFYCEHPISISERAELTRADIEDIQFLRKNDAPCAPTGFCEIIGNKDEVVTYVVSDCQYHETTLAHEEYDYSLFIGPARLHIFIHKSLTTNEELS